MLPDRAIDEQRVGPTYWHAQEALGRAAALAQATSELSPARRGFMLLARAELELARGEQAAAATSIIPLQLVLSTTYSHGLPYC